MPLETQKIEVLKDPKLMLNSLGLTKPPTALTQEDLKKTCMMAEYAKQHLDQWLKSNGYSLVSKEPYTCSWDEDHKEYVMKCQIFDSLKHEQVKIVSAKKMEESTQIAVYDDFTPLQDVSTSLISQRTGRPIEIRISNSNTTNTPARYEQLERAEIIGHELPLSIIPGLNEQILIQNIAINNALSKLNEDLKQLEPNAENYSEIKSAMKQFITRVAFEIVKIEKGESDKLPSATEVAAMIKTLAKQEYVYASNTVRPVLLKVHAVDETHALLRMIDPITNVSSNLRTGVGDALANASKTFYAALEIKPTIKSESTEYTIKTLKQVNGTRSVSLFGEEPDSILKGVRSMLIELAKDQLVQYINKNKSMPKDLSVNMCFISLLSPIIDEGALSSALVSMFKPLTSSFGLNNEKLHLECTQKILQALRENPQIEFSMDDIRDIRVLTGEKIPERELRNIKTTSTFLALNFPVNGQGWLDYNSSTKKYNDAELTRFKLAIDKYNKTHPQEAAQVNMLLDKITKILDNQEYKDADPSLKSMLGASLTRMLTDKLGFTSNISCKSAKDRTEATIIFDSVMLFVDDVLKINLKDPNTSMNEQLANCLKFGLGPLLNGQNVSGTGMLPLQIDADLFAKLSPKSQEYLAQIASRDAGKLGKGIYDVSAKELKEFMPQPVLARTKTGIFTPMAKETPYRVGSDNSSESVPLSGPATPRSIKSTSSSSTKRTP